MTENAIEGGCLCGAIRYRSELAPIASVLCHCSSCRRASGAPSLAWLILPAEGFSFTQGEPKTFRSSPHVARFLRSLRNLDPLSQRQPDRSHGRADGDGRSSRTIPAAARDLARRKTAVGDGQPGAAAVSAQQQGLNVFAQANPNGRSGVETIRSPTHSPRRKSSTPPITAVSPRILLWPRPVVLKRWEDGQ